MYSRSNHTYNGELAKKRARVSLKIASQVNEKIHLRSNTVQHLIDGHQLINIMKGVFLTWR